MSYDVYWVKNRAEKIADFEHPTYQGSNDHPSRTLIPLVLPSYMQMRECYDEGIDEHEYKTCKLK